MNPETFIEKYEAALATQDWQQVAPLVHPEACVTFSSGSVHIGKTAVPLHQSSGANPMKPQVTISQATYRRYILGKQGLWPGRRWAGKEGTAEALQSIEAVQVDPVSVLTGSQEIVLWGRVQAYQPEFLNSLLYTERRFFDYGGGLMIYPMAELPY